MSLLLVTVRQCLPNLVCESLSSFSGINLATSTILYTAAEVRRGEREVVLDIVNKFGCAKIVEESINLQVSHCPTPQGAPLVGMLWHPW